MGVPSVVALPTWSRQESG